MGEPLIGDVVVVAFPFSDLSATKRRPALVVAEAEFDDLILCQVTSRRYASALAIQLDQVDFVAGGLARQSFARPDKLFTASRSIVAGTAGRLHRTKSEQVRSAVAQLFS